MGIHLFSFVDVEIIPKIDRVNENAQGTLQEKEYFSITFEIIFTNPLTLEIIKSVNMIHFYTLVYTTGKSVKSPSTWCATCWRMMREYIYRLYCHKVAP